MKLRTSLLAAMIAASLWPAAHAAAEDVRLAQIKALVGEARQNSSGPLAGFAGVYDILKSCRPLEHPEPIMGTMWLIAKSVIWFEGDDILFAPFTNPAKVDRGTLKFKQDYTIPPGRAVKLYDLTWKTGNTDIMAFLPDRDLFDGKFKGRTFTFNYALRCGNEDQILDTAGAIMRLMDR